MEQPARHRKRDSSAMPSKRWLQFCFAVVKRPGPLRTTAPAKALACQSALKRCTLAKASEVMSAMLALENGSSQRTMICRAAFTRMARPTNTASAVQ